MKDITSREKEIAFVHFGEGGYTTLESYKTMNYGSWGAFLLALMFYAVSGRGLTAPVILCILALAGTVIYQLIKHEAIPNNYRLRHLAGCLDASSLTVYILVIYIANISDVGASLWQNIIFTAVLLISPMLTSLMICRRIQKGLFLCEAQDKRDSAKASNGARLGVLLGICICQLGAGLLTQEMAVSLLFIFGEALIFLFSFGTVSCFKLYYALKHDITCSLDGETDSPLLRYTPKSESKLKKALRLLLKALILLLVGGVLYAMFSGKV